MRLPLSLGYDVVVAPSLDGLGAAMGAGGRCVLVTNPIVRGFHGEAALRALDGWDVVVLEIPDGEAHKDVATWTALVEAMLATRPDRQTRVVALGGGVTGDIAGFAAATVLRGLPLVQVPTTLLAMVDSSVGGKTGVNTAQGKNLLGAFHQPALVWAPLDTLTTLPTEEHRSGLGEAVKHALISGEDALRRCEALASDLVARDPSAVAAVVEDSVRTKARIVEADPNEQDLRAVLNLGHTIAHALETVAGYGVLRHGEAVAIGLVGILRFARERGWCEDAALPERVERLLCALGLPVLAPAGVDREALAAAVGIDKKRTRGNVKLAVPVFPGRVEVRSLPLEDVPALFGLLTRPCSDPAER